MYLLCRHTNKQLVESDYYKKIIHMCVDLASVNEKTPYKNTALHIASLYGNVEAVRILLASGAYVNSPNMFAFLSFSLQVVFVF